MNLELNRKVAVVNGASQGIGYAIAKTFAEEGARVAMAARREPALADAAAKLREETGGDIVAVQGDIRRAEDCERIIATAAEHFGAIDILVNNDGAPPLGSFMDFDDDKWHKAVDQNLMSVVRCIRAAVPHMRARGAGSIVNITALSAIQPMPGFGLSVATWSGVIGLAKTLSLELAPQITINTLVPGLVDTPRLRLVSEQAQQSMGELAEGIPLQRVADPQEIGSVVAFLASPRGRYVTGTTIQVDGGLYKGTR